MGRNAEQPIRACRDSLQTMGSIDFRHAPSSQFWQLDQASHRLVHARCPATCHSSRTTHSRLLRRIFPRPDNGKAPLLHGALCLRREVRKLSEVRPCCGTVSSLVLENRRSSPECRTLPRAIPRLRYKRQRKPLWQVSRVEMQFAASPHAIQTFAPKSLVSSRSCSFRTDIWPLSPIHS